MRRAILVVVLGALVSAGAAGAGAPGRWTPVSAGTSSAGDTVGLVRTGDGILHVLWLRRGAAATALWQTAITPDGASAPGVAVPGLGDAGAPALAVAPDGTLRAFFFAVAQGGGGPALQLATQAPGGVWTAAASTLAQEGGTDVPGVAAAMFRDGVPVVAWPAGSHVRLRFGVDPSVPVVSLNAGGCCASGAQPAVDQVSGRAYVAWASSARGGAGVYVQAVDRGGAAGARVYATGSATPKRKGAVLPEGRVALVARPGLPGVFLAYTRGYPKVRSIAVLQVAAKHRVLEVRAPGASHVALLPGPQGRLWLAWSRSDGVYAVRTNRSATRIGAVRRIPYRRGARAVDQVQGDGGTGTLDLVVGFEGRAGARFWHQQVLPGLSLGITRTSAGTGSTRYVFRVSDAGEPVANATVKVGKQSLTTGISGSVVLVTGDRPASASASKPGYASATTPLS